MGKSPKFISFRLVFFSNDRNGMLLELHIIMKMVRYDLPIDVECVLVYVEVFGTITNAWPFLLKIWDSG